MFKSGPFQGSGSLGKKNVCWMFDLESLSNSPDVGSHVPWRGDVCCFRLWPCDDWDIGRVSGSHIRTHGQSHYVARFGALLCPKTVQPVPIRTYLPNKLFQVFLHAPLFVQVEAYATRLGACVYVPTSFQSPEQWSSLSGTVGTLTMESYLGFDQQGTALLDEFELAAPSWAFSHCHWKTLFGGIFSMTQLTMFFDKAQCSFGFGRTCSRGTGGATLLFLEFKVGSYSNWAIEGSPNEQIRMT